MQLALAETEPYKKCAGCKAWKPISEFGHNAANDNAGARDGLNIRCRDCVNAKIAVHRHALREYKAARIKAGLKETSAAPIFSPRRIARMLRTLSPADRTLEAIRCGAETQTEIAQVTKLSKDDLGECIAELMIDRQEIRTEEIKGVRRYFIGVPTRKPMVMSPREPRSFGVSTIYFSAGEDIYATPGRKRA